MVIFFAWLFMVMFIWSILLCLKFRSERDEAIERLENYLKWQDITLKHRD